MCASSVRKRPANIGTNVNDTNAETMMASPTTTANSWNNRPITPGIKKIGIKTAMSDVEIDTIVKPTSRAPTNAAWKGASPFSTWRMIFSSTTIASSTTNPTAKVSPNSEILSRLYDRPHNNATAPIREIGNDKVGIAVAINRRKNRKITRTTNTMVPARVKETSCRASRTETERSLIGVICTDCGIWACKSGMAARTVSTRRTVLAPGWR